VSGRCFATVSMGRVELDNYCDAVEVVAGYVRFISYAGACLPGASRWGLLHLDISVRRTEALY
jgi:hypothetical protein